MPEPESLLGSVASACKSLKPSLTEISAAWAYHSVFKRQKLLKSAHEEGTAVSDRRLKPSAEALLHVVLGRSAGAGSVLHTHSVWGTLLSEAHAARGYLEISGYEMLKGLADITTHEASVRVEVFRNTQDIPDLARRVERRLRDTGPPLGYAFLIAGHGLYAWGKDLAEARRHIEVLEFLFEVVGRRTRLF